MKGIETYLYVVSRGKECWTFLIRNPSLVNADVCDEIARAYLAAYQDTSPASASNPATPSSTVVTPPASAPTADSSPQPPSHSQQQTPPRKIGGPKSAITLLLFEALNIMSSAVEEGADNMRDLLLLTTKASFIQRRRAKERFINEEFASSNRVLVDHFSSGPPAKWRFVKLLVAAFLLFAVNVALYIWRNYYLAPSLPPPPPSSSLANNYDDSDNYGDSDSAAY